MANCPSLLAHLPIKLSAFYDQSKSCRFFFFSNAPVHNWITSFQYELVCCAVCYQFCGFVQNSWDFFPLFLHSDRVRWIDVPTELTGFLTKFCRQFFLHSMLIQSNFIFFMKFAIFFSISRHSYRSRFFVQSHTKIGFLLRWKTRADWKRMPRNRFFFIFYNRIEFISNLVACTMYTLTSSVSLRMHL